MRLNEISPGSGSRRVRKRRGRGASAGLGKTGGRGHKGQKSRAGGGVRRGFEGGQMPLQRKLPKFGFVSRKSLVRKDVRLGCLETLPEVGVNVDELRKAGVIGRNVKYVKVYGDCKLTRAYVLRGVAVSKGARSSIESAGGSIED